MAIPSVNTDHASSAHEFITSELKASAQQQVATLGAQLEKVHNVAHGSFAPTKNCTRSASTNNSNRYQELVAVPKSVSDSRDAAYVLGRTSDVCDARSEIPDIPKRLHWVWLGSPLPAEHAIAINDLTYHHPDFKATLWTSSVAWRSGHAQALESLSRRVRVRSIDDAFKGHPRSLHGAFIRESVGPLKNLAAASDIARAAIEDAGGIYMDVDVQLAAIKDRTFKGIGQPLNTLGNLHAPEGFLKYRGGNAVIATVPGHPSVKAAIASIVSAYANDTKEGTDKMWRVKRDYTHFAEMTSLRSRINCLDRIDEDWAEEQANQLHDEIDRLRKQDLDKGLGDTSTRKVLPRLSITMDATGPNLWARISPKGTHTFSADVFAAIPANARSYLDKPDLRRASF